MPLVEVIQNEKTSDAVVARTIELLTGAGKTPLVPATTEIRPGTYVFNDASCVANKLAMMAAEILGARPPFRLESGKRQEYAETFEALRARSLDLAKQGMQITRFKGLGEMNAEELWATTMDPARRLLIRADVEDETAADVWFSRLMGDEVEPRRLFIEENALDVRFLDV